MKSTFTAEQISHWFTSGTTFANIKLTEERPEKNVAELSSSAEGLHKGSLKTADSPQKLELKPESPTSPHTPPKLASYKYPILPITKHREKLISLIEHNSVVIIQGATGSGKTTQLPQFILDHYNDKNSSCNIVVTQPRKIGASSIARWVATERKCTLGSLVGYQVSLEKMATEHTRLIYMTTGVLLQKVVSAKCLTEYSHIFVDEVHERTEEMDFLLLVLRKLLHSNSHFVKLILMSATINCRQFAEYFATVVKGKMSPAYIFEVGGAPFAIEDFYLDDLHKLFPSRARIELENPQISEEMYNLAISLIQSFDEMEGKDTSKTEEAGGVALSQRGSVLVFLPGLNEIHHMQEALTKLVHKRQRDSVEKLIKALTSRYMMQAGPTVNKVTIQIYRMAKVYPLHSTVTLEEQNGVFLSPVPGYRKVILSTNIAESSVTVQDVKYVIDFCLARHMVCDRDTHYQSLHLTWASKTNCNQRRGRAGRVSKGYCYRLITRDFWRNDIPDYMIPEILLAPLSTTLLKVKLLDMGDPRTLLSSALSPPNLSDIIRSVLQLKEMGALSAINDGACRNEDGELTLLGRVLAHLPVNLYLGKMMVLGYVFGCLDECLIIAASLSLKTFFAIPSMQKLAGHRSNLAFARGTPSDAIACVNAFQAWLSAKKKGQLRHPKDELNWGKENFIQIRRIREVADLYEDLKRRLGQFNMHVTKSEELVDCANAHRQKFILQVVIAGAYYPNYFVQGEIDDHLASREFCGFNPRTTVMLRSLPPYSFLYYKQLQSLFRLCGQVKSISFDHSRAFVEFYKTTQDSSVLPEVSLALLLYDRNNSLELSVFTNEQIELRAGNRPISHMKYARVNIDFQSQTVSPVGITSDIIDPDNIPANPLFVVIITEVVEVGHFWAFQTDEGSLVKQRSLTSEINGRPLLPVTVSLYPNLLCLAPYAEPNDENMYYRAKVLHIRGNSVEVFFLDFGNTAMVPPNSLRELPADLLSQPFQAQEFQVAGMRPSAQSIILGNPWSSDARSRFVTLVKGHALLVSLYSILYGVMRVDLSIPTGTENKSIVDILVGEGHAVRCEENSDSKQNHDSLMSLYNDKENGRYIPSMAGSSWKQRIQEEKELIDSLLEHFSKCNNYVRKKVRLVGPITPYKVQFTSLSFKTPYKSVIIEKGGINSLPLNENPHYEHQRMLVSGSVSVNQSGSSILLRETTIMPDIPGLPALITMLFTPVMELRNNKERTCYTGALCGLGFNMETKEAVLPDHDLELAFDVKFDVEDITEINGLRVAINRMLCESATGSAHLRQDKVSQLQEDCRDRLISLFIRSPREAVIPENYENIKMWNQVDPSVRMDVREPGGMKRGALFQLHPVTLLNI